MSRALTVDRTHRERRRIVRLLDFLKRDSITREQMERIGRRLQKSGRRALPPLVRRLSHEKDQERLYRYTCMLDFFDSSTWLDKLAELAIRRRDLGEEGRLPLLEILSDYGVDVTSPPFSRSELASGSINSFLDSCLGSGISGMVRFMDSFLESDDGLRERLARGLGSRIDFAPEAAAFLGMLANFEYSEVATTAVDTLGSLRHPAALTVLQTLGKTTVSGLDERIARSIRKLSFTGINSQEPLPPEFADPSEIITVQSSPVDCYGTRTLWISWELSDSRPVALVLQTSDEEGLLSAMLSLLNDMREHDEYLDEVNVSEGMFPIPFSCLAELLKDGLLQSMEQGFYMPPEFYAARHFFGRMDLRPEKYLPSFPAELLEGLVERLPSHMARSETLLEEPFFEGWILYDPLLYELAGSAGETPFDSCPFSELNPAIEQICAEILEPQRLGLLRRLLLTADFMHTSGAVSELVQRVLALGLSFAGAPIPLAHHPFIRRFLIDSLEVARQSLAEGYDPRRQQIFDDEEWE